MRILELVFEGFRSSNKWKIFIFTGLLLIVGGGILYATSLLILLPLATILLIFGVSQFLQASTKFRVDNPLVFTTILFLTSVFVLIIDFWPLQLFYGHTTVVLLQLIGGNPVFQSHPHLGGLQILLHIQDAQNGRLVGGEIDNACAGLIVLIPIFFLLISSKNEKNYRKSKVMLGIFSSIIVIFGNHFRIFIELWLPSIGAAPFILVHYPLAFLFGIIGLGTIVAFGEISTNLFNI